MMRVSLKMGSHSLKVLLPLYVYSNFVHIICFIFCCCKGTVKNHHYLVSMHGLKKEFPWKALVLCTMVTVFYGASKQGCGPPANLELW